MSIIEWYYKNRIRPRIFEQSKHDAELAHEWGMTKLMKLQDNRLALWLAGLLLKYEHPMLKSKVFGLHFPNPLGLAAGFDKYCQVYWGAVPACGWGFAEIGGITRDQQGGNERPRMMRSEKYVALWNFMGFNNPGADKAQEILDDNPPCFIPVGLNVGKSKNTPLEKAVEDYCYTVRKLWTYVDYIVINPSSPNTPGLRSLQSRENLRELILAVQRVNNDLRRELKDWELESRPIGVKISPDESDEQLQDIVDVCRETKIDFIVATNTTVDREVYNWNIPQDRGGVSGSPLLPKAEEVMTRLYKELKGSIPLVGVGGIVNGRELYRRISHGANLCQAYTAWPYEGPDFVKRCLKHLVEILKYEGFTHVSQAVGSAVR